MKMKQARPGLRVQCAKKSAFAPEGVTGTVQEVLSTMILIVWDQPVGGLSLNPSGEKAGYAEFKRPEDLTIIGIKQKRCGIILLVLGMLAALLSEIIGRLYGYPKGFFILSLSALGQMLAGYGFLVWAELLAKLKRGR